jgi:hypothetical protein
MKRAFLSKRTGWILIVILVYIDAVLDLIMGRGQANPLWIPVVERFGSYVVLVLAPLVVLLFYIAVKIFARLVVKIDKTPFAEEILITTFVVVYGLFDLWLISVDFFGFRLIRDYRYTIPFLAAAGLVYSLWAERQVKRKAKKLRG